MWYGTCCRPCSAAQERSNARSPKPSAIGTKRRRRSKRCAARSNRRDATRTRSSHARPNTRSANTHAIVEAGARRGRTAAAQTPQLRARPSARVGARERLRDEFVERALQIARDDAAQRRVDAADNARVGRTASSDRSEGARVANETLARRYAIGDLQRWPRERNVVERVGDDLAARFATAIGRRCRSTSSSSRRSSTAREKERALTRAPSRRASTTRAARAAAARAQAPRSAARRRSSRSIDKLRARGARRGNARAARRRDRFERNELRRAGRAPRDASTARRSKSRRSSIRR